MEELPLDRVENPYQSQSYDEREPLSGEGEKIKTKTKRKLILKITGVVLFGLLVIVCVSVGIYYAVAGSKVEVQVAKCLKDEGGDDITLVYPDDDDYDNVRWGMQPLFSNSYPDLVVQAKSKKDIQAALYCARSLTEKKEYFVNLFVMNGGHSFQGYSSVQVDTTLFEQEQSITNNPSPPQERFFLLLNLDYYSSLLSYDFNAPTPFMTIESGMRLGRLQSFLINISNDEFGFPKFGVGSGTCPTVGVTGHILCGGYGRLGRYTGLTSDQVLGFKILLPDGEEVVTNSTSNSDLFWALRGSCSAVFGIITEVTIELFRLPSPNVTTIDFTRIKPITGVDNCVKGLDWFQNYFINATNKVTGTTKIYDYIAPMLTYLGPKDQALEETFEDIKAGLGFYYTDAEIEAAYVDGTYEDAVLWWSKGANNTSELDVQTLPPSNERGTTRRKCSSYLAMDPLPKEGLELILNSYLEQEVAGEMKSYGGVNPLSYPDSQDALYDNRSPLRRGHVWEFHFWNSWVPTEDEDSETIFKKDTVSAAKLTQLSEKLKKYNNFTEDYPTAYPGYTNADFPDAGVTYFGKENAQKLRKLRQDLDVGTNVLASAASRLLYPNTVPYVYVGSSDSITVWSIDRSNGKFTFVYKNEEITAANWLHSRADGTVLWGMSQVSNFQESVQGGVAIFHLSGGGGMSALGSAHSGSAAPTTLVTNDWGSHIYLSHSCGNTTMIEMGGYPMFPSDEWPSQNATHPSVSDDPHDCEKVDTTHAYINQVLLHPTKPFIFTTDLTLDKVYTYSRELGTGKFTPDTPIQTLQLKVGSGPRHLVIHPSQHDYLFLVSEYANTLTTLHLNTDGELEVVQIVSTLRESEKGDLRMAAAEIQISNDGNFVYVSNCDLSTEHRSSIALFSVEYVNDKVTGVKSMDHYSTFGDNPIHFSLTPSGSYLLVANKDSNNLANFEVDQRYGWLTFLTTTDISEYTSQPTFVQLFDVPVN